MTPDQARRLAEVAMWIAWGREVQCRSGIPGDTWAPLTDWFIDARKEYRLKPASFPLWEGELWVNEAGYVTNIHNPAYPKDGTGPWRSIKVREVRDE